MTPQAWATQVVFDIVKPHSMLSTIMFIALDELLMSSVHRRVGPLNLGWYGLLAAVVNGVNLALSQAIFYKMGVLVGGFCKTS